MALNRSDLKKKFNPSGNSVPAAADYNALINSVLNLRDDQFYGVWRPDGIYYSGGIVIYDKSFYCLTLVNPNEPYCSVMPPDKDTNWQKVQESITDYDWFMSKDQTSMYANEAVSRVGIGTSNPQATLEVASKDYGSIRLQPNLSEPQLVIENKDPDCKHNSLVLRVTPDAAQLETDSEKGLQIFKKQPDAAVKHALILSANASDTGDARVGIGTDAPATHLEIVKEGVGNIQMDAGEQNGSPSIHLQKEGSGSLSLAAGTETASIQIQNTQGLFFQKWSGADLKTQVAIDAEGDVGIGTETPKARLHITTDDNRDGHIKLGFCYTYPVLNLINNRVPDADGDYNNALAIGASMDAAVFKTDSAEGFSFKTPAKTPADPASICDLNEGNTLAHLYPEGVLTVGDLDAGVFKLDVDAFERSYGAYTNADRRNISPGNCEPLGDVMPRICDLKPVRFKWKNPPYGSDPNAWFLGLVADEVKPQFPEVVLDDALAYPNLVPVLIRAIQQQQGQIDQLNKTIAALDARIKALEK